MQRFENLDDEDMSLSSKNSSMFSGLKTHRQQLLFKSLHNYIVPLLSKPLSTWSSRTILDRHEPYLVVTNLAYQRFRVHSEPY
jgi:hypothetical protein